MILRYIWNRPSVVTSWIRTWHFSPNSYIQETLNLWVCADRSTCMEIRKIERSRKKSRIPETLDISTDADSITIAMMRKHRKNHERLPREYFISCWGVNFFLLKYVTITTFFFKFCHTLSFVTIWVFEVFHYLIFFSLVVT